MDIISIITPKDNISAAINNGVLFGNKNNVISENIKQLIPATKNSNAVESYDLNLFKSLVFCNIVDIYPSHQLLLR